MPLFNEVPCLIKAIQGNLFTTQDEANKIANIGSQYYISREFVQKVAKDTEGALVTEILSFLTDNLACWKCVEVNGQSIRFFTPIYDGSSDGAMFSYNSKDQSWVVAQLVGVQGITTERKLIGGTYGTL